MTLREHDIRRTGHYENMIMTGSRIAMIDTRADNNTISIGNRSPHHDLNENMI